MASSLRPGAAQPAPGPDDAALQAAATEYTLPSGRTILWLPPDEMEMLAFTGALPDPITAAVYLLLEEEGAIVKEDDPASYHKKRSEMQAKYHIIKHGMVKPRFDPSLVVGDGVEVIGRRQLTREDVSYCYYYLFRLGTTPEALAAANANQPDGLAHAPSASGGIRAESSGTDQAGHQSDRSVTGVLSEPSGAVGGQA